LDWQDKSMALREVTKHIVYEAEQRAKELQLEANTEVKRIQSQLKLDADSYGQKLESNANVVISTSKKKELAAAEFDGKRLLLDAKTDLVEKVVSNAMQKLSKLPREEIKQILETLFVQAKKEILVARVYINKKDKSLINDPSIVIEYVDISGGLIAETDAGDISVNLSFDELLQQIKDSFLQELSKVVFND
jgi:V/A-type H+/Na+-transporting ATPase subunit E